MRGVPYKDLNQPLDESSLHFNAVLYPNQSFPKRHFAILTSILLGISVLMSGVFSFVGAWPVAGFFGLDIFAIIIAFLLSYRSGKTRETLLLQPGHLVIKRFLPSGKELSWSFNPNWMSIEMDDPPLRHREQTLHSHGKRIVIGSFLTPAERLQVAAALRSAIHYFTNVNH